MLLRKAILLYVLSSCYSFEGRSSDVLLLERETLMDLFGSTQTSQGSVCANVLSGDLEQLLEDAERTLPSNCNRALGGWVNRHLWGSAVEVGAWFGITADRLTGRVVKIELGHNGLQGQLPDLSPLGDLKEMDLRGNKLSGLIPDSLGRLTALTHLYLSDNTFSGSIPEAIGLLSNLERLHISYASVSGAIPEGIGKLKKLTHLDLSENQITGKLPKSIRNLTKLTVLYVNHNKVKFKEKTIRNMLPKCQWVNV